ncbi:MAG TPA: CoA-transferase [Bacillota bacterium]|nr:CoA-transferase [Bacillota bacterium]
MPEQDFSLKEKKEVVYRPAGSRRLFCNPDADAAREYFHQKSRRKVDKTTTVAEAVKRLVCDGDYIGVGGFGSNRIPTAVLHEIVRRRKKNLGLAGHTATHDFQILVAGGCINRCDAAYIIGLEARGLSKSARRAVEQGEVEITEWTNAALAWRYKAAAMGLSFIPARSMMGTDTVKYSAAVEMECPFTGKKYLALPALYPDVAIIHVHRADVYGNCQIDGIMVSDYDLARAAKKLIITTEKLVPEEYIRRDPERTVIPYYLVDAVIEVPFGSYPGNMPYLYFSDEEHLQEWLQAEQEPESLEQFLQKYIYGVEDFWGYLNLRGGLARLSSLMQQENLVEK